jgi:phosphoribosylamine--glycine ligase
MRVLLVGSGGREHALAWALSNSPLLTKLFVAPGNPGTATIAENVRIDALDIAALVEFARGKAIDLVVPGPEAPLVAGLADALAAAGIRCCGPTAAAARLEGSKRFAKEVCEAAAIPTARWESFDNSQAALEFISRRGAPVVVKADGLAGGKGVVVATTEMEAEAAVRLSLDQGAYGAGASIIIEECLCGDEVSLFALCDGTDAVLLGAARDHKRVGDGDTGPNTGGMGAVSPPPGFGLEAQRAALELFIRPAVAEMARRGTPFTGVLFAGLMLTKDGPKLIEYNVRLGDPETQALLPRLSSDLLPAFVAACEGTVGACPVEVTDRVSVAVVVAARGYPGAISPCGTAIRGFAQVASMPHVAIFHGGTDRVGGEIIAIGGRALTICATGTDLTAARHAAYAGVRAIVWDGAVFRTDIGLRPVSNIA